MLKMQREVLQKDGKRLRENQLVQKQKLLMEGRFFHGIVTYMSSPLERHYFILDSKRATLSVFHTLK